MIEEAESSTKVYYHIGDSTPYMSVVAVPHDRITLGDFRNVFRKRGYRFFCKVFDHTLDSEVKVEVTDDSQLLQKSKNGLVVLYLLSTTTERNANSSRTTEQGLLTKRTVLPDKLSGHLLGVCSALSSSTEEFETSLKRVSLVTNERSISREATSEINTLISKRAGEDLAPYASTSDDLYKCESATNCTYQGIPFHGYKKRNQRKSYKTRPYIPSTISSASESSYSLPCIEEVKIHSQKDIPLGISVASQEGAIFIYNILPGSMADKSGLKIGDQIIQVENTRFEQTTDDQALNLLKNLTSKNVCTIYIVRSTSKWSSGKSSSLFDETLHLDVNEWVESSTWGINKEVVVGTKKNDAEKPVACNSAATAADSSIKPTSGNRVNFDSIDVITKLEMSDNNDKNTEIKNSVQNENSFQAAEKIMFHKNKNNIACAAKLLESSENRLLNKGGEHKICEDIEMNEISFQSHSSSHRHASKVLAIDTPPLTLDLDPLLILRQMVQSDSGLDIRNRKWLKMSIPLSFIGVELINWLVKNVQGFRNRKAAKNYASSLLANGYIRHVANIRHFSEKSYYVFDDSIIAERVLTSSVQTAPNTRLISTLRPLVENPIGLENTTEITYMSTQSPLSFQQKEQQITTDEDHVIVVNNPKYVLSDKQCSSVKPDSLISISHPLTTQKFQAKNWPLSPILSRKKPLETDGFRTMPHFLNKSKARVSPTQTNDYASMIQCEINCGAQFADEFHSNTVK